MVFLLFTAEIALGKKLSLSLFVLDLCDLLIPFTIVSLYYEEETEVNFD